MTTTHTATSAEAAAYARGRQDEADACARRHLVRIADVLDAIEQHAGNIEKLRSSILVAIGHATP